MYSYYKKSLIVNYRLEQNTVRNKYVQKNIRLINFDQFHKDNIVF